MEGPQDDDAAGPGESLVGSLLVASPALADPNFERAVILVVEHSPEGAAGVVLNRPSEVTVGDAVPELTAVTDASRPVFVGGPVKPESVSILAAFSDPARAATVVVGDIGLVPGEADLDEIAPSIADSRIFAGYAGWGEGQLEAELEEESWFVAPAHPEDAIHPEPDELWSLAVARKGGWYRVIARMPEDPRVN